MSALRAAAPFAVLGLFLVVAASATLLPAGPAFAVTAGCVLAGSFRVLLVYRERLVAARVPARKR